MTTNVLSSKHVLTGNVRIHVDDYVVQEMTSARLTTMFRNASQLKTKEIANLLGRANWFQIPAIQILAEPTLFVRSPKAMLCALVHKE
jgi:hypothetical protein